MVSLADYKIMLENYGIIVVDNSGSCDKESLLEAVGLTKTIEEWDEDYEYKISRTVPDEDRIAYLLNDDHRLHFTVTEDEAIAILKYQRDECNNIAIEVCSNLGI